MRKREEKYVEPKLFTADAEMADVNTKMQYVAFARDADAFNLSVVSLKSLSGKDAAQKALLSTFKHSRDAAAPLNKYPSIVGIPRAKVTVFTLVCNSYEAFSYPKAMNDK